MERQSIPIGPSADGSRIMIALLGLSTVNMILGLLALVAWGVL